MKASELPGLTASTLKSFVKVALLSRPTINPKPSDKGLDKVIILGNGPSLKDTLAQFGDVIKNTPSVAVNFMANTPQFFEIRPDYYVLADPLFFNSDSGDNFVNLWNNLSKVSWPLTLCVPANHLKKARKMLVGTNAHIKFATFNFIGFEGFEWAEQTAFRSGLAMPRPRNVLIPAIMTALKAGYRNVYVAGADHSWTETLRVDDSNHVVSVQPHFYSDSKSELKRSATQYMNIKLHEILLSFHIAFKSYHTLRRYADKIGAKIINITPDSFIDAFERGSL